MEDGILYNLPNIERNILNDGIIEQSTLGSHFTHVRLRNETRRDEVMPNFGDICQMLGLEVDGVALIVEFPLTPPVCQDPKWTAWPSLLSFHSPRPFFKTRMTSG